MNLPEPQLLLHQFLQTMRMRNCSERTVRTWRFVINRFAKWCQERGIECMSEITPELMAAYRRSLFHYRNPKTGRPLKFESQAGYLIPVGRWFNWMVDQRLIEVDPAKDIELPKAEQRLPTTVLTAEQVERLLNLPDVTTLYGLRDRAIMETFYSCGIRCGELIALDVYDISHQRGVLTVRLGKNMKDRVVPIGERALSWIEKWTNDIRPDLVTHASNQALFLTKTGRRMHPNGMTNRVRRYLERVGVTQRGSCHLLRHTAATLMMENGADLRSLQMYLGHSRIKTTQIYTHVSIKRLQDVHRRTHPATPNRKALIESKNT
jgi:integrase/recombinase XerD